MFEKVYYYFWLGNPSEYHKIVCRLDFVFWMMENRHIRTSFWTDFETNPIVYPAVTLKDNEIQVSFWTPPRQKN